MSTWIVTTGNSDVQLKHDKNWGQLYDQVRDELECDRFASLSQIDPDDDSSNYTAPARVLGLVYGNQPDYYKDLEFPLLDTFCQHFEQNNINLEKIIVLLTNQLEIFPEEQIIYEKCPYWQDTLTLQSIFKWYFKEKKKFNVQLEFKLLEPKSGQGLDHWNETLLLVETILKIDDYNPLKTVYISHQAGTPAISSAVQFVSLSRFKKVNFIVSNQYYDADYNHQSTAESIPSSEYGRGIQIQKAKQLIIDGFPGAALKVLEGIERIDNQAISELKHLVNFFNLYSPSADSSQDFEIAPATQRIVDTLDLICFCFNQKNYLQGIALLASAQETFLKAAICNEIAKINQTYKGVKVAELVKWTTAGLYLIGDKDFARTLNLSSSDNLNAIKKEVLSRLKFPVNEQSLVVTKNNGDTNYKTNANNGLLKWLRQLRIDFKPWAQLQWSCNYERNHENDLRNQLMHNLRGMEESDVIDYLLGYENHHITNVMEAYNNQVKQPFLTALTLFNLPFKREKLTKKLQQIADALV